MDFSVARIVIAPRLYIVEERYETVVHVQLLVAVDVGVIRIKCPIDAAPLAKAGESSAA